MGWDGLMSKGESSRNVAGRSCDCLLICVYSYLHQKLKIEYNNNNNIEGRIELCSTGVEKRNEAGLVGVQD